MMKINVNGVPDELKIFKQWVCWKYEHPDGDTTKKPTKVPYSPVTNRMASSMDRFSWCTFNEAVAALDRFDGVGFVLTKNDQYCVIDLDETSTPEQQERFVNYYNRLNSFTEISPSGSGCHVWVKAEIPKGRNVRPFEIYDNARFITVTGNVHYNTNIQYRQDEAMSIYNELSPKGGNVFIEYDGNDPEPCDDQTVLNRATAARNGYKFYQLWNGNFSEWYSSQSEADLSLINILAFYTQNAEQIARLFFYSALGQRDKAKRDGYVEDMITKSFDKLPPKVNTDAIIEQAEAMAARAQSIFKDSTYMPTQQTTPSNIANILETDNPLPLRKTADYLSADMATLLDTKLYFPKGLVGDIAEYVYRSSPRPVREIALTSALGLMCGIAGGSYNISSTGLNMYILVLASTGAGKEALSGGISKLLSIVSGSMPSANKFIGASFIASPQALLGYLGKHSRSQVSIIGESGLWIKELSDPSAPAHIVGLRRVLLDLYGKSGRGSVVQPSIYASSDKNTQQLIQPAFSLLGESTLTRFYEAMDEVLISEGFVPRWLIIEYDGKRPPLNTGHSKHHAPPKLIHDLVALCDQSMRLMETYGVIDIGFASEEAEEAAAEFDRYCDAQINGSGEEAVKNLWTRAYLKMLKLAGLVAVGRNIGTPLVDMDDLNFAKLVVLKDTVRMCNKYRSGSLAAAANSASMDQQMAVSRAMAQFVRGGTTEQPTDKSYGISPKMRATMVIPYAYLQRKCTPQRCFSQERTRRSPSQSLHTTLADMEASGIIVQIPKEQAAAEYEFQGKLWAITNFDAVTAAFTRTE